METELLSDARRQEQGSGGGGTGFAKFMFATSSHGVKSATMPLLSGIAKKDAQSQDTYKPVRLHKIMLMGVGKMYTYGEAGTFKTPKGRDSESNKKKLWEMSEA